MLKDAVRQKRKRLGYSRTKFAALLGVRPEDVAGWEDGEIPVSTRTVQALMVLEHGFTGSDLQKILADLGFPFEPLVSRRIAFVPAVRMGGWRAA